MKLHELPSLMDEPFSSKASSRTKTPQTIRAEFVLDGFPVELSFRKRRRISIRVSPPDGRVRMSVPHQVSMAEVIAFATADLAWIQGVKRQIQERIDAGTYQPPLAYVDFESHLLWGAKYTLRVFEQQRPARVAVVGEEIQLFVRKGSTRASRQKTMARFYASQVQEAVHALLLKWEPVLQVRTQEVRVQKMKSRWGSCFSVRRIIKLNTELATRSPRFLDFVVLHELVHFFESGHGVRFKALMTRHMPAWRAVYRELKASRIGS